MQLACPHCQHPLEFSGPRPSFCAYCGQPLPPSVSDSTVDHDPNAVTRPPAPAAGAADADPAEVGGYRLLSRLGEGGMGRVYEAEDPRTGRRVALKLIAADYSGSPDAVERFRREGRVAAAVAHPRCVFVLAADEDAGRPYIVMELMPGETLQDLLDRQGSLPVDQALVKIFDVIDGLREAHRLGVVHRDVKPSNCFLDRDGRVKVGDFGLSKSLVAGSALTRTGSFIGTPLFASPEQIKGDAVGPQADVYSVAATLYCLLTGRAPFQGTDPAATLARIVSDPAPPMRTLRPKLPADLDRAVLRGLERDRAKRWRDLDEFQAALAPFVPGRLSAGGLGLRFGAILVDYLMLAQLGMLCSLVGYGLSGGALKPWNTSVNLGQLGFQAAVGWLLAVLYFAVPEAVWGRTPGKHWLGLRVQRAADGDRPAFWRTFLRVAVWYGTLHLASFVVLGLVLAGVIDPASPDPQQAMTGAAVFAAVFYPLTALGFALCLCTMRARNGYRGLHEWASGTRVVRLPAAGGRRLLRGVGPGPAVAPAAGRPERVGGFVIRGLLSGDGPGEVLVGEDASLGRPVWVWLRPDDAPPLGPAHRELNRAARLRWLAGGRQDDRQWDAFLAPAGGPLTAAVAASGRLAWGETRGLLAQLADELAAAAADGTLPAALTVDHVWVRADGRLQLVDVPAAGASGLDATARSLALLRDAAVLALEGKARPHGAPPDPVRAPLPLYAARLVGRLLGQGLPYRDVREFQADLAAAADRPADVTRPRRLAHLAVLALLLSFGLCMGLYPPLFMSEIPVAAAADHAARLEDLRSDMTAAGTDQPAASNELSRRAEVLRRERDARLQAQSWPAQAFVRGFMLPQNEKQREALRREEHEQLEEQKRSAKEQLGDAYQRDTFENAWAQNRREAVRASVEWELSQDAVAAFHEVAAGLPVVQTIWLSVWPALWVLWAFVFRGGLSYRLSGLALVRGNGRPALRVQCAWRALLVWLPVVGLMAAGAFLEARYWSAWAGDGAPDWLLALANAAWWAALAVFPLYVFLALLSPRRAWHDRLAGTHLVPR
jgi:hypothetical protein